MCVCVCVLPIHSGHQVRWTYQPGSHRGKVTQDFSYSFFLRYVCVCVFSSHSFWTSSSLDVPAGVTQEEGHTGFLIHLLSAVRAFIFLARRIQPFLSLVDCEVEFCVCVFCVFFPFIVDFNGRIPAGVTQEEGNTGFSIHLLPAVLALIFLARRIQPFLSLVDCEVEFCVLVLHPLGIFSFSF